MNDFSRIIDLIAAPYFVCSRDGLIVASNSAFEDLIGWTQEELTNFNVIDLFVDESQNRVQSLLNKSDQGLTKEFDLIVKKKSKRKLFVDIAIVDEGASSEKDNLHFTFVDKTKIRKLEDERTQMLKQASHQSKMTDLGILSAGISHELNNPLAIIKGYADMSLRHIKKHTSDSSIQPHIEKILEGVSRMTTIIDTMRLFSRKDDSKKASLSLQEVVSNTVLLINNSAEKNDVAVVTEVDDISILGNRSQIQQMIMNIFNNAIHAFEDYDIETETERWVSLKTEESNNGQFIDLLIANNGPMIPAEIVDKIFNPFFTTKDVGEGTGLGLSLAYDFMRAHHGSISLKSNTDITEFRLRFPSQKMYEENHRGLKVLAVDDEIEIRNILSDFFGEKKCLTTTAQNGFDAMRMLEQADFDVVITDINMPRVDGARLIEEVRKTAPNTIVIAISGRAVTDDVLLEAKKVDADIFFSKPLDTDAIYSYIIKNKVEKAS